MASSNRRAVGVVRVSRVGDRDGERFVSPSEQAERIRAACERDGLELVETIDELDVSGGTPLERRPGLSRALDLIESGRANVAMARSPTARSKSLGIRSGDRVRPPARPSTTTRATSHRRGAGTSIRPISSH